jgi:hypothetical protein
MTLSRTFAAALLMIVAAPALALACPVCGTTGPTDNGGAYVAMTVVLSGLPLAMIGGVVFWVARRVSAADAGSSAGTVRD